MNAYTTLVNDIHNFTNTGSVKKLFRTGSKLFTAFKPFVERPTWWNIASAIVSAGEALVDENELWGDSYFDSHEWTTPYTRHFTQLIVDVLVKYPYEILKTANEAATIRLVNFDGIKAGWVMYAGKSKLVDAVYFESTAVERAKERIKEALWRRYKDSSLVMRYADNLLATLEGNRVTINIDNSVEPLPSEQATCYTKYLKRCIDAGVHRSLMLYGPPGTGKSTMAKTIVDNLGFKSFRLRIEDIDRIENGTIFEALSIFQPDAVILDDFDRVTSQAALLETLEFFQKNVKLVIATVNDKDNLDVALLRPGRFDELVLVDKMDENVIRNILDEYQDGFELVKNWPITFVQEYVKRRRFMSLEEAQSSMKELSQRVQDLQQRSSADELRWDRLLKKTSRVLKKQNESTPISPRRLIG
jgi:adenylate kinase family enzyme